MAVRLKYPYNIFGETGVTASRAGVPWDGSFPIVQSISVGNDISTTGNVQFNAVTSSGYDLDGYILLADRWTTNFSAGSIVTTGNITIPGNATISGIVTAEKFEAELTSSAVIYKSGSTQFGDSLDDTHYFTGSLNQTGSFVLNGYSTNGITNDASLTVGSQTSLVTENAAKGYADTEIGTADSATIMDLYLRANYNKTAASVSNNTASFYAFTASAGMVTVGPDTFELSATEEDFLFFNNGQIMEHDALTIEQSGSNFLLIADSDNLGYNLESSDEINAWGKFNPTGYLDFDGLTNEVTTTFSGSGATPLNKTYSWWMKSSETARNYAVFAYGNQKIEGFVTNFSNGRPLIWNGNSWFVYWDAAPVDHAWDGEWHHWMCYNDVLAITGSKLYVDGTLIAVNKYVTAGTVSNLNTQSQPLTMGSYQNNSTNTGRHFEGSLDEFAIFSGDKTSNASTYYNNGKPTDLSKESDLQGYWRFEEGSGSIAKDTSGQGNNGTVNGATWSTDVP